MSRAPRCGFLLIPGFPLLAAAAVAVSIFFSEPVVLLRPAIVPLLGVIMSGMGLTLAGRDFIAVAKRPGIVALAAFWPRRPMGHDEEPAP